MSRTSFAESLVEIISATTVEQTATLALAAFVILLEPDGACLLVWDTELGRYTLGATWLSDALPIDGPAFRRAALRMGQQAHAATALGANPLENSQWRYQSLNRSGIHIGALVTFAAHPASKANQETLLIETVAHTLYNSIHQQQAERERAQLEAERARLEQLLRAVAEQQRTIDHLLTLERQFSTALEVKVEERTAELRAAQARLIQSEKLAVIGELAGSLAHELNNPLQAIQSGLGLVLDSLETGQSARARQDLAMIQHELERMAAIFRQMLDFYRPGAQVFASLDLNAICEGARVLMRKRLQEQDITLTLALTTPLPLTCGDGNQLKQVLLNLMLNAAEALAPHPGHITLRTAHDQAQVCLTVSDDGPGIPPDIQGRIFEPLFTTKRRGLGLGLAISREIIERHAGQLTVESAVGVGTTFTVRLPIRLDTPEGCIRNAALDDPYDLSG
jgi:C4-dicarboxylate-specific signal transduction histidine kinase